MYATYGLRQIHSAYLLRHYYWSYAGRVKGYRRSKETVIRGKSQNYSYLNNDKNNCYIRINIK